jgi:hypothetical protein
MRSLTSFRCNQARMTAIVATVSFFFALTGALADEQQKDRPKAPADHAEFESDMSGSYFVTKALKDLYDNLVTQVGELRTDIDQARINESQARAGIAKLQSEIDEVLREIKKTKLFVPGATVQHRAAVKNIPLGASDLLLIEAENVEIQRGDGPDIKCVVKKTVLGDLDKDQNLSADFDGIELVVRKSSGKEMFGFYKDAANRPDLKHHYDQFPFKPFLNREFTVITLKGLSHEEGNRQISVDARNELGSGTSSIQWRRHAKLSLTVPKCQGVAIQGGLGGLLVRSLDGPLMIQGSGARDFRAQYRVTDLNGSLTACGIPLHEIDSVTGNVSIVHTAYTEDALTTHGPNGVDTRTVPPKPSRFKGIRGGLEVNFCRADLTIEDIGGRVDVQNDFGRTVWHSVRPVANTDHRIVSQSGAIEVSISPSAMGKLNVALFTSCGAVRLPGGDRGFESRLFRGDLGDTSVRSWTGFASGGGHEHPGPQSQGFHIERMPAAWRGDRRSPGIDVISRAGTITYEPIIEGAPGR